MDLNQALGQFDAIDANLGRLEEVCRRYDALIPEGITFSAGSPEQLQADDLRAAFTDIAGALPPIDGWRIDSELLELDDIAQNRMDAAEIGEVQVLVALEAAIARPVQDVAEYRRRFGKARRALVRDRARELVAQIDELLRGLGELAERTGAAIDHPDWDRFKAAFAEIERLLGDALPHGGRWNDLKRHIAFGQRGDLCDIVDHDWPDVRGRVETALYGELEPLPVAIADLADVLAARPAGPVSTKLAWEKLDADAFERLTYNLFLNSAGYENVSWAMRTNAPDRGRDIAADRVSSDELSGVRRLRIIVQCKHWLSRSISAVNVAAEVATVRLQDDPPVDVLVIVTSGRFTADAVTAIEQHNQKRDLPAIEYWPESHLESLLAQRPALAAEFDLRA